MPTPPISSSASSTSPRSWRRSAAASSETRLGRLKAFAQDALRKRDDFKAEAASSARALAALQAEAAIASSMLSSGLERIFAKAAPATPPARLPTSHKYSAGLPALAYGVLKRANDIVDDLLAQIDASHRDRDDQMDRRNYQIAIEVSELEAAIATRAAESESLSDRDSQLSDLHNKLAALHNKLAALQPILAGQIACASKLYDEVRQVVVLVDEDAAVALPDSVFIWKEDDMEEQGEVCQGRGRRAHDHYHEAKEVRIQLRHPDAGFRNDEVPACLRAFCRCPRA